MPDTLIIRANSEQFFGFEVPEELNETTKALRNPDNIVGYYSLSTKRIYSKGGVDITDQFKRTDVEQDNDE